MADESNSEHYKTNPDYGKAAVAGAGGAVVGAGAAMALGFKGIVLAFTGGVGFALVFGAMMSVHAAKDAKILAIESQAKKKINEAWNLQAFGRYEKAEKLLQDSLNLTSPVSEKHVLTLSAIHSLGNLYRLRKTWDKAEQFYKRAIPIYESIGKTNDSNYAECLQGLALTLEATSQYEDALQRAAKAQATYQALGSELESIQAQELMARLHAELGQKREAIDLYSKVKESNEGKLGEAHDRVIGVLLTMARLYREENMLNEALDSYKEVLLRMKKTDKPRRQYEAEALVEMAELRLIQGQPKDVEPLLITGLKLMQQYVGPNEQIMERVFRTYREAREKLNLGLKENDLIYLFGMEKDKVRDVFRENVEYVNAKDKTGWGPLQWACFLGRDDLLRWLLRNGSKPDNYEQGQVMGPIHVAAAWSKMSSVVAIIEAGQDIDSKGPMNWTPLFFAAQLGRQETLEQLVVRGAKPTFKDAQGRMPLHVAAEAGHASAVTYLLDKCDKDAKEDKDGRTALHLAAAEGHGNVVEALLNNQADLNAKDKQGKTPIQLADEAGHKRLVLAFQAAQMPAVTAKM